MGACFEDKTKKSVKVNQKKYPTNNLNSNVKNISSSNLNENNQKQSNENKQQDINIKIQNKSKNVQQNYGPNTNVPLEISKFNKGNNNVNLNNNTNNQNNNNNPNNNNQNILNNTNTQSNNNNSNNAIIFNNESNIDNNKIKEESENIKKSILKLKSAEKNNLHIQKTLFEKTFNCKYKIVLKITIKKVSSKSNFEIRLTLHKKNDISADYLTSQESEKLTIDKYQVVTFNEDFILDYYFNVIQPLYINITRNRFEENLKINLADIIGKPRQTLFHSFPDYECAIEAKMHSEIKKQVQFLVGLYGDLKEKNIFYNIKYLGNRYDDKKNDIVYTSDVGKNDNEIIFKQIELPFEKISEDEKIEDNLIQIEFYNKNNGNDEELGKEKFSIEQLLNNEENEFKLQDDIKAKIACKRKNFFNLLEYFYNGFNLITTFCIDFSTNSLIHTNKQNFENLLQTFLDTLLPYNGDKFFYCYSYGFKLIKTQKEYINEIFPLNRKSPSIEMSDVITYFEKGFKKFESSSKKNDLGLIIKNINDKIKENYDLEDKQYNLFIIFASYDIDDIDNFMNQLIETSKLNISIVIIPIGNGSFTKTKNIIKSLNEGILKRNCVKFLEMNNNSVEMVKNSLIDIPDSMIDFFCDNNILPTN